MAISVGCGRKDLSMKQLPERAVSIDRLGIHWDPQLHSYLPPSNGRTGDACLFAFPLPKREQHDVSIEVIGRTIAEYVYDYFPHSRVHSGVFLRLQGSVKKEPRWPLWERFHLWNLLALSPSEIRQSHPPVFLSLTPNILCTKGGINGKVAILRISGNP